VPHRARATLLAIIAIALAVTVLTACGNDDREMSLAIEDVRWSDAPSPVRNGRSVVFVVECADDIEVTLYSDGAAIPAYEVRGKPRLGRCRTEVRSAVFGDGTKIIDFATGEVVDLPEVRP
jgi:hypothetical protein